MSSLADQLLGHHLQRSHRLSKDQSRFGCWNSVQAAALSVNHTELDVWSTTDTLKVGIAVAQGIENAQVIMTDLPEAEEIVARNISHAKPANGSHVRFQHLDWDDELPQNLRAYSDSERNHALDMIFAADCTYNSDSRSVTPFQNSSRLTLRTIAPL